MYVYLYCIIYYLLLLDIICYYYILFVIITYYLFEGACRAGGSKLGISSLMMARGGSLPRGEGSPWRLKCRVGKQIASSQFIVVFTFSTADNC